VDGLPVGLAFAGTAGSEETLIRLAATLERDLALAYRAPSTG
jgi:Asp-tRNA(Asn)/Glu-tRNA(Gln) amidotransferase A subunit family amidase